MNDNDVWTGPLREAERKIIVELAAQNISMQEISDQLGHGRKRDTVERFLTKNNIPHYEIEKHDQEYEVYLERLHNKEYWKEIQLQFDEKEQKYFESTWINAMLQFKDNVLFLEELQINKLVTVDILLNRTLSDRRKHVQDMERLQGILDAEYDKSLETRNVDLIVQLESDISYSRNSLASYNSDYTKLLDKQKDINKDLKATRDQRIKRVEDSKTSYQGWLKALEDEELKDRIGYDAGLMAVAKNKARQEMSEYHVFTDNNVDQPFLTSETAKDE